LTNFIGARSMQNPVAITVALVGNPNAGKTTLFNALSGLRQRVGNYPGVTVEMKKGRANFHQSHLELIDLPGTYSLAARSIDEMVAVDLLLGQCPGEKAPDVIVAIVDASNLERHLYLTTQLMDLGRPVVLALNMIDVAQAQGIRVDAERLEKQLGIRVVPIQANRGIGLDLLKQAIVDAAHACPPSRRPKFPESFEREVAALSTSAGKLPDFMVRRLLLDVDGYAQRRISEQSGQDLLGKINEARTRLAEAGCSAPIVEARTRYAWIRESVAGCIRRPDRRPVTWTDRLDKILTHRIWGTLAFLVVMFLVFQAIFTGAKPLMDLIDSGKNALATILGPRLPAGPLKDLLLDGVLNGVGSVFVFLPQIVILFAFIAILEDCGYMARAAFLMDRLMARCGLSGKSFIPMLSSVACAVPGIMATRVIENRRDRLATILVAPLMSCSARLPVYTLMIGAFIKPGRPWWVQALTMFAMYLVGLIAAPLVALALKRTLLRGETPVFVMEMPVYKWPSIRNVIRRAVDATWSFMRRAGTVILATMVLVWAAMYFPVTDSEGSRFDLRTSELQDRMDNIDTQLKSAQGPQEEQLKAERDGLEQNYNELYGRWKQQSLLGRAGRFIEPAVRPLGWDWRIGMAAMASFPAREVVVGTLGVIYNQGKAAGEDDQSVESGDTKLGQALRDATWDDDPSRKVFTVPTALSLMVFFALCCQCASTLAVIQRETRSWRWPAFTFAYMTGLAYVTAMLVFQVGTWIAG
jgi:ferrous iron transport protein B